MAAVKDWTLDAAEKISRRVLRDGDRSDIHKMQRIIAETCPFKSGVTYVEATLVMRKDALEIATATAEQTMTPTEHVNAFAGMTELNDVKIKPAKTA